MAVVSRPLSLTSFMRYSHTRRPVAGSSARIAPYPDSGPMVRTSCRTIAGNSARTLPPANHLPGLVLLVPRVVDAGIILPRRQVEQARRGAEGRRVPVRPALHSRIGQRAFGGGHSLCDLDGAAALVETRGPRLLDERIAQQEFAGAPIQHVEEAVAIAPQHRFARLALPVQIGQHRDLHRVVIETVMRRELKVPFQFAGVGVERHHRIGVEVVAGPESGFQSGPGLPMPQ